MPRGPQGEYSLPNGTLVSAGDTIQVSQHNPAMSDIAAALSQSLSRTGQGAMQAPLDMGGYSISNASNIALSGSLSFSGVPFTPSSKADATNGVLTTPTALNSLLVTRSTSGNADLRIENQPANRQVILSEGSDGVFNAYYGSSADGSLPLRVMFSFPGNAGTRVDMAQTFTVQGRGVLQSVRGGARNILVNDGTSAPSGGSDGDFYFQYS